MITVDPDASTPPFAQVRDQIIAGRDSGELPAGHRLPPVRHLATELGLAPNTVARAYRELEAAGVIETRGRKGSFVTGTRETATKALAAKARAYVEQGRSLGLDDAAITTAVVDALRDSAPHG